ncbi:MULTISPECIES: amino acid ABC transporter permease [Brevibacillus]|uniref:Cystine transporter permease n=1 Tax=Brevibacillus parabrevis TaxID=54914 RepID=A0A4Y3PHR0_BREPA|nr:MULTISPECIES: amino acid ABC transporter permease [Brevibacillus]NRQ51898.1 amino acid ABC transporter permease [Brevibacillus sp. HD1.4A]KZE52862.1 cystine transporter permease [Brevibacillus parabrevis]MBU8711879.1 amino acid ABC transporter permease [Brevibacillus parabrevis]MDH6348940.1 polar amino acid transport system permease protein [Brevibacillus sp. 1238]MDR5000958.1 amino acid ABC transporter permease [Brevibacillus parabrevis]
MPSISHLTEEFFRTLPFFWKPLLLTFELTVASVIVGSIIGLFVALLKVSKFKLGQIIANVYIMVIRGTPLIVQIFVLYFGFYKMIDLGQFWSAALALAIHSGAYIAEIFRGSIQSIDKGQMEAGLSLGMSSSQTMRRIILPQAMKRSIPPLGNQFILSLKESSLAAFIAMDELFSLARRLSAETFDEMTYFLIVALYYLVIVMIFTYVVHRMEKRLAKGDV